MSKQVAVAVLERAQEILKEPQRWTNGRLARNAHRAETSIFDEEAVCFCSLGAIVKAAVEVGAINKAEQDTLNDHREVYEFLNKVAVPGVAELAAELEKKMPSLLSGYNPVKVVWRGQDHMYANGMNRSYGVAHQELMNLFTNAIQKAKA